MDLDTITPRWAECIVAATGPSLTPEVAERCKGLPAIAVNDAYRLLPFAEILYACDAKWWDVHHGCPDFRGEKWSSHSKGTNDKTAAAARWGLRLVRGAHEDGFSMNPSVIHYGSNSGFQAINLALLMGAKRVLLVGFDMRTTAQRHFFGHHPAPLNNAMRFETLLPHFCKAARRLPPGVEIVNCTPRSALDCFPMMNLEEALGTHAVTEYVGETTR